MSHPVVVAPATPSGVGALAVIRVTGTPLLEVLDRVVRPHRPGPWRPQRVRRVDVWWGDERLDDGLAVFFRGPRSYTGEDLCELSIHGNPRLVERVVGAFVEAGARLAQPGELTRRAVVNGKLDLVQAEGVDALIRAASPSGLTLARAALDGRLSAVLRSMSTELVGIAAELEARLDWPGDELALQSDEALLEQLASVERRARQLADTYRAGRIRIDGARVALVGPVNAGKSSLFNQLLGEERAIVHPTPGTTRDVVEARALMGGLEVTLLDTAGERQTSDPIEQIGLRLGRQLAAEVDLLLVVVPADARASPEVTRLLEETAERPRLLVLNRVDLAPGAELPGALATSASTGQGIEALRQRMIELLGEDDGSELMLASARQRDRLLAVSGAVAEASRALPGAGVAVAADLVMEALQELDGTRGHDVREAVLDEVFRRFCIGK
jgi:tRNA modification GTPase